MSKRDRKQDILNAAYRLFARMGNALSMAEVAQEVGLRPASLYSHFESKEQIIFLTAQREVNHYYDLLALLFEDCKMQRCQDRLAAIYFFTVGYFEEIERLHFWQHLLANPDAQLQRRCRALLRVRDDFVGPKVSEIIQEGLARGIVRPEAAVGFPLLYSTLVLGMVEGILIYDWPQETLKGNAKLVWDNFARGVFFDSAD